MNSFNDYLAHGNAWLFIPAAIVLGMLHGLEPGHSKTMMAAFIVSIRGTVRQAMLLGVSATISHTANRPPVGVAPKLPLWTGWRRGGSRSRPYRSGARAIRLDQRPAARFNSLY